MPLQNGSTTRVGGHVSADGADYANVARKFERNPAQKCDFALEKRADNVPRVR
jgi:hypothetical protein